MSTSQQNAKDWTFSCLIFETNCSTHVVKQDVSEAAFTVVYILQSKVPRYLRYYDSKVPTSSFDIT